MLRPHSDSCMLTLAESILLLLHVRRLGIRPYLTESVLDRMRVRILKKYGVDIDGPLSPFAYELLESRGGDIQLWFDNPAPAAPLCGVVGASSPSAFFSGVSV